MDLSNRIREARQAEILEQNRSEQTQSFENMVAQINIGRLLAPEVFNQDPLEYTAWFNSF